MDWVIEPEVPVTTRVKVPAGVPVGPLPDPPELLDEDPPPQAAQVSRQKIAEAIPAARTN